MDDVTDIATAVAATTSTSCCFDSCFNSNVGTRAQNSLCLCLSLSLFVHVHLRHCIPYIHDHELLTVAEW